MLRNPLLVRLTLVVVGSIVGLSLVLVIASTQGDQSDAECLGAYFGEDLLSGNSTIVACVNGLPITAADIAVGRAQVAVNLEHMRDVISRIVPASEMRYTIGGTPLEPGEVRIISNQDGLIPESDGLREAFTASLELIEQHGVDTVVLGWAILERALFAAATAAGHSADDAEIAAQVEDVKTALAEGLIPELESQLSAVDEEVYFAELLPGRYAQEHAIWSWRLGLFSETLIPPEDFPSFWPNAQRDALSAARVHSLERVWPGFYN